LRQITVVPVAIVSGFAPNAAAPAVDAPAPIVTVVLTGVGVGAGAGAAGAGAGAGVGATGEGLLLLLPQAVTNRAKTTKKANFRADINTSQIQARESPAHQEPTRGRVSLWQNDGHLACKALGRFV
jgi:hypothetical protein